MTPAPSWMRLSIPAIALAGALVARADVPPYEYSPPPPAQTFEPIEPNPYFVQDPADPRILHPAPGFFERGIDRGYIERMVRGDIPPEVFDELEAAGAPEPGPVPNPVELQPPPGVHFAVVQSGNVLVVEGDTQLVVDTKGGPSFNHNGAGLQRAVSAVWTYLGDNYDFITVFTTFDDPRVAAY